MFSPIDLTGYFINLCFAVFVLFWIATSFTNKRTIERRGRWTGPVFGIALFYMFARIGLRQVPWMNGFLWQRTLLSSLLGDAMALAGLAVMLWARVTLGRNWSGGVVLKEDHQLVTGGPYRFVRHPIYSGLLPSCLAGRCGGEVPAPSWARLHCSCCSGSSRVPRNNS